MEEVTIDEWFSNHLFGAQEWYPERIGPKRVIFSRPSGATLLSMAIDPPPEPPSWRQLPGLSLTGSLFALLRPLAEVDASIVYLTYPDGAWIVMHGHYPLSVEAWNPWLLRFFEETPAEEGGPQMVVALLRNKSGALVFGRFDTFEISFYGPDALWTEISVALYGV